MYLRPDRHGENVVSRSGPRQKKFQRLTHNLNQFHFTCFFLVQHSLPPMCAGCKCVSQVHHHETSSRRTLLCSAGALRFVLYRFVLSVSSRLS